MGQAKNDQTKLIDGIANTSVALVTGHTSHHVNSDTAFRVPSATSFLPLSSRVDTEDVSMVKRLLADRSSSPHSIRKAFAKVTAAAGSLKRVFVCSDILTCPTYQCFSSILDSRSFRNMPRWSQAPTEAKMPAQASSFWSYKHLPIASRGSLFTLP